MTNFIKEYNKHFHTILKSLEIESKKFNARVPFGITDNTALFCQSWLDEFEKTSLTPTRRYSSKDIALTESDRESVFYIARELKISGYEIKGLDNFI